MIVTGDFPYAAACPDGGAMAVAAELPSKIEDIEQ